MLFSEKIPSYVAARLNARYIGYPISYHLSLFATIRTIRTIRDCSPLFALFETIRTIRTIRYSLIGTIRCSLFATFRYSPFGFPDTQIPWSYRLYSLNEAHLTIWSISFFRLSIRTRRQLFHFSDQRLCNQLHALSPCVLWISWLPRKSSGSFKKWRI